jgi:hypothetical protein
VGVVNYSDKPVLVVAQPAAAPYGHAVIHVDPCVPPESTVRAARRLAPQAETHLVCAAPTATGGFGTSHAKPPAAINNSTDLLIDCVTRIGADLLVIGSDRAFQHAHDDPGDLIRRTAQIQHCDFLFVKHQ